MPPPDDPRNDQQLIAALNAGDAAAFDALYYRYRDRVLRLAVRFTGNHDDALDVPAGTVKSRLHHAIAAMREDPRIRRFFKQD